jgi:ribulose 1,5-bisphosphate carboxylase large subunit-like protein
MAQSVEAWQKQISLQNYAKDHKELETALKFFGT